MSDPGRGTALGVAVLGSALFVGLAWWWIPWDPVGTMVTPVDERDYFTVEQIARAEAYARWARTWNYGGLVASLAVAAWLGFTSAGRRVVARIPGPTPVVVVLAVAGFEVAGRLVTLPFSAALHSLRREVGLSTSTWEEWGRDVLVAEAIVLVPTSLAVLLLVWTARRWQRAWPGVVGLGLAGLVVLGSFAYPVLVEPAFNRFEPLAAGDLRSEVLELGEREGVAIDEVLVADASRRTTSLNAYVSGFGPSSRVVLYDTLLEDTPQAEVLAIVAHELSHARNHDVVRGTVLGASGVLAGVGLLGLTLGTGRVREPTRVPLVLALVAVAGIVTAPVEAGISRQLELRADVEALAATGDPDGFVQLQQRLVRLSLRDPTPPAVEHWWFGSHPTSVERLGLAESAAGAGGRG